MDGHPMVEEWVGMQIGAEADLVCAGHGADIGETASLVARGKPHLVLLEIANDVPRAFQTIRLVTQEFPEVRFIVFTSCDEVVHFAPALRAGAHGFVSKAVGGRELLRAIRRVLDDDLYLSKAAIGQLLVAFSEGGRIAKSGPSALLSERELQVFAFIGEGLRPTEIAQRISLSVKTVESYQTRIREKLQVRDARALFQDAVKWSKSRLSEIVS